MVKPHLFKQRASRLFISSVAAVVAATFGVAIGGMLGKDNPSRKAEPVKTGNMASAARAPAPVSRPKPAQAPASAPAPLSKSGIARTVSNFRVKRVMKIDHPLNHGDYVWDDKDVPPGPIMVTVDLKAQTLSVFRGGYEIGVAVILYGADDKESPLGVFPITQKDADHYSNIYNSAPMPYALRLTNDGVFIHGSDVLYGEATHGCIGIPKAFAKKLFAQAKVGDLVIITNGKMMDIS